MYHRIAEIDTDPWQLAVSPANFEQQLHVLSRFYKVISVENLVSRLGTNSILHKGICLTFDDGYRDNFFSAKPLLEKYNCPATFFIASHYVDKTEPFWWDELENIILHSSKLPQTFSVTVKEDLLEFQLENEGLLTKDEQDRHKSWVWPETPPTARSALYLAIWERLKPLPYPVLKLQLEKIKQWAGSHQHIRQDDLSMKTQQIESISNNPLFTIGIHTATHPALAYHSAETQFKEMQDCKQFLEKKLKHSVTTVAYPYGNYDSHTIAITRELQLKAAFTTEERIIMNNDNVYRLGRVQVKNWNGEEFERRLNQWIKSF